MTTLHRTTAGYITRFADTGLAEDEAILLASTENVDRMGDIVVQSGIDFRTFMASGGPILRDHNTGWPVGNALRCSIEPAGLTIRIRFAPEGTSDIADETRRLVKTGVLRGVSIGFMPKPGKAKLIDPKDYNSGFLFEAVELYECSICSVQANRESLVIGKSYDYQRATRSPATPPENSLLPYAGTLAQRQSQAEYGAEAVERRRRIARALALRGGY